MVSKNRVDRPLRRLMRESHQVFRTAAVTSVNPSSDPQMPSGERIGSAASSVELARMRKEMWAASETSQESIRPNNAAVRIYTKAFLGAHVSRITATATP